MSALPNSHEVLLKNQNLLRGRLAIIGMVDPALLPRLPDRGLTISEHFGNYQQLLAVSGWTAAFGLMRRSCHRAWPIPWWCSSPRPELSCR